MLLSQDKNTLGHFSDSASLEWLETNGLGGWAGSTLVGCNTRRYHGLLMAATVPPTERMLLVSKLDESILQGDKRVDLGTNDYGDAVSPDGFQYLTSFQREFFPEWIFEVNDIRIRKTITMVYGENTTLIRYEVLNAVNTFTLELLPLIAARTYHTLQHAGFNMFWDVDFHNGIFHNQPFEHAPHIYISVPGSSFHAVDKWYYHLNYLQEKYRGLDYIEDLFNHGVFRVDLKPGDQLNIIISTDNPEGRDADELFEKEKTRKASRIQQLKQPLVSQLLLAADQFIVKREAWKTVIAGYHWFTDWSRDTMISLPGLCLQSGRFDDARKIFSVFAKSASMGMLPNRFMDNLQPPEYNTVDGTLWFFNALYDYWRQTGDSDFIIKEMLPVLKDIIAWHKKGTRYNIHVDRDGLLYAGEEGQQLTWMDARVGTWVVTPRMGKPVEIEALWFNALRIFESFLLQNEETTLASETRALADLAKKSFSELFWNEKLNCLFDVIDEHGLPDPSIRPNQIFSLSLPFPIFEGEKARAAFGVVRVKLFTYLGLRSLSPDDPKYKGHYGGDQLSRDSSYHQGTVWSWLLGPFLEAGIKLYGDAFRKDALLIVNRFSDHLNDGCIGTVSEIFDGDAPHHPRGCVAQAWGVAEILRVIQTYSL